MHSSGLGVTTSSLMLRRAAPALLLLLVLVAASLLLLPMVSCRTFVRRGSKYASVCRVPWQVAG